jgi:hypothetical protein
VIGGSPEHLNELMIEGMTRFGKVIRAAGIKPE